MGKAEHRDLPKAQIPPEPRFSSIYSKVQNSHGIDEQKLAEVVNAGKNEMSGITGTTWFWGFPPGSSAAVGLSHCGAGCP